MKRVERRPLFEVPNAKGTRMSIAGSPSSDWSLEDLAAYVQARQNGLAALAKKSTVEVFKAGHALSIVKAKVPGYMNWLKENQIKVTTAWEAVTLFEKAGSEEAIKGLTLTQAKKHFGVIRPRKDKAAKKVPPPKEPESVSLALKLIVAKLTQLRSLDRSQEDQATINKLVDEANVLLLTFRSVEDKHAAA